MRAHPGIGIALTAALILGGCGNNVHWPSAAVPALPAPSPAAPVREIAELLAAPDSIVSGGVNYFAVVSVWRDFSLGSENHRAVAVVQMRSAGVDSIPSEFHPKYVWVIHGTELWGAELTYLYSFPRYANGPAEVRAGAFAGPEWPTGDTIQVVTGVPDSTGYIRLLRCPDTTIFFTS